MKKMSFPALKGSVGDWIYYICILPIEEIGRRVSFADEVHQNKRLSDMIQRELKKTRAVEIAEYLATQEQRFFNSMVLAVYDKEPTWYPVSDLRGKHRKINLGPAEERTESLGVLEFSSKLEMFAIDGQHRLAGIRLLLEQGRHSRDDYLPIVLVGHKKTPAGLERTRRLFTTLNKTAKVVSKGETISLDEDDAAAIVVRRLVEKHAYFKDERIAYLPNNNLPATNQISLTTIGNLYDVVWVIFESIRAPVGGVPDERVRPDDATLDECEEIVVEYFKRLAAGFPPVREFFSHERYERVVERHRGGEGGHILFRPVGLKMFAQLVAELVKQIEFDAAMEKVSALPVELSEKPYVGLLWDPGRAVMTLGGKTIVRDLLRLSLGLPVNELSLKKKLAAWLDKATRDVNLQGWVP